MKLTKKEAIDNSILKWAILAETGDSKKYLKDITTADMPYGCALCQLAGQRLNSYKGISRYRCRKHCPYAHRFRCCCNQGSPFEKWSALSSGDNPERVELHKKYAKLFLEQLREL